MSDSKFFSTTKKGEIHEFKEDLRSLDRSKRKDTVKKVIAAMTIGKDVSMLFADVCNCMQTEDLELKKLVYLYLINYAKSQPDLAIMAVNTFVKDAQDPNPLIRALAVRTMGCIRVDKITEYLCDPLQRCLKDDDPYVRKTAAVCVAKLHDINPDLVEDRGFLETLKGLLADSNPMVVANAVATLAEIQEVSGKDVFQITSQSLFKLLRALNECTEWGQVFILDSLANYEARDAKDAEGIIERVTPRLQHANCSVVLSALKVILNQLDLVTDEAVRKPLMKKLAPPLVTLLSAEPEIQYVALRNINLVVQKYPQILSHEVKVFFCKYNDPIYVKLEKLEVMVRLASERNIDQVLLEFKEYATEVDVDFVRKAVRAIGRCAVSLELAAERCVNVLLELIQTKMNYVVQEAIIVIKDIFRRYPNRYESIISTLCENLDTLDEPEAKASMIWIIGEYAERIDNADDLLEQFLETFPEESSAVQLQLVSATVKLFLKRPTEKPQQMIQLVLTYATQETDNPDLRDRAYVYWRLLSTDPEAAKDVILADKPVISDTSSALEPVLLETLLANISSLASVYHKPPDTFVSRTRLAVQRAEDLEARRGSMDGETASASDAPVSEPSEGQPSSATSARAVAAPEVDLLGDLLDISSLGPSEPAAAAAPAAVPAAAGIGDGLGGLSELEGGAAPQAPAAAPGPTQPAAAPTLPIVLPADKGKGLAILAQVGREGPALVYRMTFQNSTPQAMDGLMIQFNKNSFGLAPAAQAIPVAAVPPGGSAAAVVKLVATPEMVSATAASPALQVAIRTNQVGVLYLNDRIPADALLLDTGAIAGAEFVSTWKAIPDANETSSELPVTVATVEALTATLAGRHLYTVAHKVMPNSPENVVYASASLGTLPNATQLLLEVRFVLGAAGVKVFAKSHRPDVLPLLVEALPRIFA